MHLPSAAKLWHMPLSLALPMPKGLFFLLLPLEEQETSYFAAPDNIFNFSCISIASSPN
jgi:hypothetical protein